MTGLTMQEELPYPCPTKGPPANVKRDMTATLNTPTNLGEVFTKEWVVEWILDLVGYDADAEIWDKTIVEPSCGAGAFLLPIVRRLVQAALQNGIDPAELHAAIWATDLQADSLERANKLVVEELLGFGVAESTARALTESWLHHGDYLLGEVPDADWVVGNPPYVRLEDVDESLMSRYRATCSTMTGRSDIYVGFYEKALTTLKPGGQLGFICADRWMRNAYGQRLRRFITDGPFSVDATIQLHDVDCFDDSVSAYPAVTVMTRKPQARGVVAVTTDKFDESHTDAVTSFVQSRRSKFTGQTWRAAGMRSWFDEGPWPEGTPEEVTFVKNLERDFSPLQDAAGRTRVGIGVATGADAAYITTDMNAAEPSRMLPLVMSKHIASGGLEWTPTFLVNPWADEGLVDINDFSRMKAHLAKSDRQVRERHVAAKNSGNWYRTIDRVNHELTKKPKILLADMKSRITPVVESGVLYPHHNLYWITSDVWPIESLAGLLLSDYANHIIKAYCVKMRGGTLRFQAQYLRKICVPDVDKVSASALKDLQCAYATRCIDAANAAAERAYGRALPPER